MTLKMKEATITMKATLNTGDYSNLVLEVTLTAEIETAHDALELRLSALDAMTHQVAEFTENRLTAGIPALNGKQGALRRQALESQPCVKVLATLSPEMAKETVDRVFELSLAPERKAEAIPPQSMPVGSASYQKFTRETATKPTKSRSITPNYDRHDPTTDMWADGHPDDYGDR